jgi:DNA segregation ATPase FtsK/SpoIIIE-like protein
MRFFAQDPFFALATAVNNELTAEPLTESVLRARVEVIRAYREQGINLEVRGVPQFGPRFNRFEVRLASGMRVDGLRRRTEEVQHRLGLTRQPLIVQDGGRLYVDLERADPESVAFSSVIAQLPRLDSLRGSAHIPLGVNSTGHLQFADLASSGRSHVLVAGTTGSGKSEWLRMILAGLIASNSPDTVRFVTLDPKLAAFTDLEHSRYLFHPQSWWIPNRETPASEVFDELVQEMDRRYALVRGEGCDHLRDYVEKVRRPLTKNCVRLRRIFRAHFATSRRKASH